MIVGGTDASAIDNSRKNFVIRFSLLENQQRLTYEKIPEKNKC